MINQHSTVSKPKAVKGSSDSSDPFEGLFDLADINASG
jgi:hypothetical protein